MELGEREGEREIVTLCDGVLCMYQDVNDQNRWVSAIRKACLTNRDMIPVYHPGSFKNGKWTCCRTPASQGQLAVYTLSEVSRSPSLPPWLSPPQNLAAVSAIVASQWETGGILWTLTLMHRSYSPNT